MILPTLCAHLRRHGNRLGCAKGLHDGECKPALNGIEKCPDFKRAYRKGERPAQANPTPLPSLPCIHLGEPIRREDGLRETVECPPCSKKAGQPISKPVHACAVHGRCITDGAADGVASCGKCNDRRADAYLFTVDANGIGDHLIGLAVCAAWKRDNPTKTLVYRVRHRQWVELFDGYDHLSLAAVPGATPVHPGVNNRGKLDFVEGAARVPRAVPTLKPLPSIGSEYAGCVVLSPLVASNPQREWLLSHWHCLERALNERGVKCIIVGGAGDESRLPGFVSPIVCGQPAARVAAILKASRAVIGNDSGIAHLAGALGVPCIALSAALDGPLIYSAWPSVEVIQAREEFGRNAWANLQRVTPATVLGLLQTMIPLRIEPCSPAT